MKVENVKPSKPTKAPRKESAGRARQRPLRVLFVQDHLGQSLGLVHGVTRYFLSILPAFDRHAVQPHLCVLTSRHPIGAPLLEAAGIAPVFLGRGKWDPRGVRDLVRLIRSCDIDLLHVSGFKAAMLGRIAAVATGRPVLVHLHDARPMASWVRLIQHRLVPWTYLAIVVSEALRPVAVDDYGMPDDRVQVIYNGVDRDTFARVPADARQRIRHETGIPADAKVIGMVGRVEPGKGMRPLLEAMPEVRRRSPGAVLLVVGDGTIRPDCERLAEDLGIAGAVRFTGFRNDIPELLAAMDVMAAPSIAEEGLGYAVLEGMCAGLPVVASRSGGLAESVVDGTTGFLVPRGSVSELASALATILNDDALRERFAVAGRQRIGAFSVTGHVQRLEALYGEVMGAEQHPVITVAPPSDSPRGLPRASGRGA